METKGLFQIEITINVQNRSVDFICIPMLWVYGHCKIVNSFMAGTVLDVRI